MNLSCLRPVGLDPLCDHIEQICTGTDHFPQHPGHIMTALDSGEGRTTFLEYMADCYKLHHVLPFFAGPDDVLEVRFTGALDQLHKTFDSIEDASVYANSAFDGVIAMDIASLSETHLPEFVTRFRQSCSHASVVFFLPGAPSRSQNRLAARLQLSIPHITPISVPCYTLPQLSELTCRYLKQLGVILFDCPELRDELCQNLRFLGAQRVSDISHVCNCILSALPDTEPRRSLDHHMLHTMREELVQAALHKGGIANA